MSGIHDTLAASDYLPITVWIGSLGDMPHFEKDEAEGLRQINRLLDRRVDGLIMWPPFSVAYYHHFPEFVERRVPVAVIDHYSTVADSVETDEEQATVDRRRSFARLGPSPDRLPFEPRNAVANVGRQAARLVRGSGAPLPGRDGQELATECARHERLARLPASCLPTSCVRRPCSPFPTTRRSSFIDAAVEMGMKIPHDLSIVGFADLDFAATMDPPLTTMRQKPHEIGRLAAKLIMDRIDGMMPDDNEPTTIKVPAELIVRESTAAPSQNQV